MSKKWLMLFTTMLLAVLLVSGCGKDDKEKSEEAANATEESDEKAKAKEDETDENDEAEEADGATEEASATDSSNNFADLIAYMEEETEGETKVLYENDEAQVHKMEGVSVTVDGYTLVELNDFHTDFDIPFNDQTDGGVIIAKYTVTNELDKDAYYMPAFYMSFTGAQKAYSDYKDLLPEEEQLFKKLSPTDDYLVKAGESITGYYAYPFGKDHLDQILDVSTVVVEVPQPHEKKGDVNSNFGKKGKFTFSLNEEGAKKVAESGKFYQDKATSDDMGEKQMLKEKDGIGKSEKLRDVTVTLDGYQFTEFIPNSVEAPRFEAFKNGVALVTVKFNIDNGGSDDIGLNSVTSKLTVDGAQYYLNEGMLLDYRNDDLIKAGESGELLQIFTLDLEEYEKLLKDKSFDIEIGPMKDQDAKDISKGKKAVFDLPN